MTDDDLPPLPRITRTGAWSGYTADQMHDFAEVYAHAAVKHERKRREALEARIDAIIELMPGATHLEGAWQMLFDKYHAARDELARARESLK